MNERCEEVEAGTSEVKIRKEKDRFVVGKGIVSAIAGIVSIIRKEGVKRCDLQSILHTEQRRLRKILLVSILNEFAKYLTTHSPFRPL